MKEVYVVNCCRTAVGSFGGNLKDVPAVDLGAAVVKEVLKRGNVKPEQVDELMFGCILTAALGQNPARQVGVKAGAIDDTMETVANQINSELTSDLEQVVGIIEPTLVAGMAMVVGAILMSVMLPLMEIMSAI